MDKEIIADPKKMTEIELVEQIENLKIHFIETSQLIREYESILFKKIKGTDGGGE